MRSRHEIIAKAIQTRKNLMSVPERKYQRHLPNDLVNLVKGFYQDDDIRRSMTDIIKDTKFAREDNKRVKKE